MQQQPSAQPESRSTAIRTLHARIGTHTDPGRARDNNEDRLLVFDLNRGLVVASEETLVAALQPAGLLLGVADGMGGMIAGEVASQMCVDQLPAFLRKRLEQQHPEAPSLDRRLALTEAIEETNQFIYAWASADEQRRGMGTTLTAALLAEAQLYVAQVGDSRAYLWRAGKLQQLTRDQTVWNSLSESGQVSLAALGNAAWKHLLTQAVGALPAIQVEVTETALHAEDWLLLCSDGLHRVVGPEEMAAILRAETDPAEKARELVACANQHGGPDNISVIVCQLASTSG